MDDASFADIVNALIEKDAVAADAVAANDELERGLEFWLVPSVALRRAELDFLRRKLEVLQAADLSRSDAAARLMRMETEFALARQDVDRIRRSLSWRITVPVRWAYERFRRLG
jgi:hypothetical protein